MQNCKPSQLPPSKTLGSVFDTSLVKSPPWSLHANRKRSPRAWLRCETGSRVLNRQPGQIGDSRPGPTAQPGSRSERSSSPGFSAPDLPIPKTSANPHRDALGNKTSGVRHGLSSPAPCCDPPQSHSRTRCAPMRGLENGSKVTLNATGNAAVQGHVDQLLVAAHLGHRLAEQHLRPVLHAALKAALDALSNAGRALLLLSSRSLPRVRRT